MYGEQTVPGWTAGGHPLPPLHAMVHYHRNGVCGHSDQVRHLSGPAFSMSVDFFRPVGRRRATRCAPTVPSARKCYVVVFQSAVWCGSVTTLVADPSFTRPTLQRYFSLPIRAPVSPPSARPPTTTTPRVLWGRGAGDTSLHGCGSDGCRWCGCPDCMGRAVRGAAWGVQKRVDPDPPRRPAAVQNPLAPIRQLRF